MDWTSPQPLTILRALEVVVTEGRCRWPGCDEPGTELAHLEHRGRGGRESANTWGNVGLLCNGYRSTNRHHDRLDVRAPMRWFDLAHLIDAAGYRDRDECDVCGDRLAVVRKRLTGSPPDAPRFEWCEWCAPQFTRSDERSRANRRRVIAGLLAEHKRRSDADLWPLERLENQLREVTT